MLWRNSELGDYMFIGTTIVVAAMAIFYLRKRRARKNTPAQTQAA